jgi:hypothetical protein
MVAGRSKVRYETYRVPARSHAVPAVESRGGSGFESASAGVPIEDYAPARSACSSRTTRHAHRLPTTASSAAAVNIAR